MGDPIASDVRGPYPDGYGWRCMFCGATYPKDYEPNKCEKDGAGLARTMLSFRLPGPPVARSGKAE